MMDACLKYTFHEKCLSDRLTSPRACENSVDDENAFQRAHSRADPMEKGIEFCVDD